MVAQGASVIIFGRTPENADRLVEDLGPIAQESSRRLGVPVKVSAAALELAPTSFCDACINCTPIGMKNGPSPNASPLRIGELAIAYAEVGGEPPVVMDTVYNPLETPMLALARTAGFRTIDGLGMFVRQATMQFRAWTGREPPPGMFDEIARRALFGQNGA